MKKLTLIVLLVFLSGCTYSSENFGRVQGDGKVPIGTFKVVDLENGDVYAYRRMAISFLKPHPVGFKAVADKVILAVHERSRDEESAEDSSELP